MYKRGFIYLIYKIQNYYIIIIIITNNSLNVVCYGKVYDNNITIGNSYFNNIDTFMVN